MSLEAKICCPQVQSCELTVHHCPRDLEHHHFVFLTAKAVCELHIPHRSLLVGGNKVQHDGYLHWLFYYLKKEVLIMIPIGTSWIAYDLLCGPSKRYQEVPILL